jgi:hypothetical protein
MDFTSHRSYRPTRPRRGIRLEPDGAALLVRPAAKLTAADRQAIRSHTFALLDYLRAREAASHWQRKSIDLADYLRKHCTDLLDEPDVRDRNPSDVKAATVSGRGHGREIDRGRPSFDSTLRGNLVWLARCSRRIAS